MARCDLCGNDYDKAFTVTRDGETRTFDSFECAISLMAPIAVIAAAGSSAMALKRPADTTAARTVRA